MRLYTVEECPRPSPVAALLYKLAAVITGVGVWAMVLHYAGILP